MRSPSESTSPLQVVTRRSVNVLRPILTRYRLLVALKAAIGVTAAWLIGRLLPMPLEQYAYYAPLGALLGVAPTIVSSMRTSLELLSGIAIGLVIGWSLVALGWPWYVRAPLAAGLGMLIAGVRKLGEGRVYVAIAGVFVVILGAGDPESYVAGYIAQFGLGLAVGTLVNLIFIPPLAFGYARARVAELKTDLAASADDLAEVLGAEWPPDRADWLDEARRRQRYVDEAEAMVQEARESGFANPRALWRRDDASGDDADIETLRYVGLRIADIADALSGAMWQRPVAVEIPVEALEVLGDALHALAEYLRAWNTGIELEAARAAAAAEVAAVGEVFMRASAESGFGTIVFALRASLGRIDERTAGEQ
ncbi:FUSC family protein [Leucobacter japonicus]|uniref:FUSC family protein n=1 Tax=Leucobacter japonicus TaxID=1461259 RepID=UPI0006A79C2A|nr:aromatic acid exporter family protein [Leucobacter japonicus]